MKTVNPSTTLRINGEHPSTTLGTSPEFIEGRCRTINPSTTLRVNSERCRTIKFYTLGCKVNQYETQSMRERFMLKGFKELDNCKPANFYVINTCTVTHRADAESLNLIRHAKRENPKAKIIVTGCLTELDEHKIKEQARIYKIVKNRDKDTILENKKGISFFKGHTRAFLKIQDGCSNNCSYCKVSLVRGPSRSRPFKEIIKEAGILVDNGFKEIVLTGICLGSYGKDLNARSGLVEVIKELENIEGLFRIRLSSIEPQDISDDLIKRMAQSKKLCPHLHIPLQSGDNDILEKMNRKYKSSDYLNLINKLKRSVPKIAITTDVLVGFPKETEINFQNTLNLIKQITPLKTHIFPYSERQGTFASKMFNQKLGPLTIKERIARLGIITKRLELLYKKRFLSKKTDILIEGRCRDDPCYWQGFTANYIKVKVKSERDLKNKVISVKLKKISNGSVLGGL